MATHPPPPAALDVGATLWTFVDAVNSLPYDELARTDAFGFFEAAVDGGAALVLGGRELGLEGPPPDWLRLPEGVAYSPEGRAFTFRDCNALFLGLRAMLVDLAARGTAEHHRRAAVALDLCVHRMYSELEAQDLADALGAASMLK